MLKDFWGKIKKLFSNKKFLVWFIFGVSVLIVLGVIYFFWAIYHSDKPAFVPEDTRGAIREDIQNNIAEPLAIVWPAAGNALSDSAYVPPFNADDETFNNTNGSTGSVSDTANWQTYTNAEFGFSLKYPEGWTVVSDEINTTFFSMKNPSELEAEKASSKNLGVPYWGGEGIAVTYLPNVEPVNIDTFLDSYLGTENVDKQNVTINGKILARVIDSSPNRFGGGTGYYYYLSNDGKVFEIAVDYYLNQTIDELLQKELENMVGTISAS